MSTVNLEPAGAAMERLVTGDGVAPSISPSTNMLWAVFMPGAGTNVAAGLMRH